MDITYQEHDLPKTARRLKRWLKPGDIVGFSGELAAGKTTLVKALLEAYGYPEIVNSPTFVIEHRYPLKKSVIDQVIHLDFYRLQTSDLKNFDWDDYLHNPTTLVLIEWPEIAADFLPGKTKRLTINKIDEKTRRLTLSENFTR